MDHRERIISEYLNQDNFGKLSIKISKIGTEYVKYLNLQDSIFSGEDKLDKNATDFNIGDELTIRAVLKNNEGGEDYYIVSVNEQYCFIASPFVMRLIIIFQFKDKIDELEKAGFEEAKRRAKDLGIC